MYNYVFAVSQSWTHWTHSAYSNILHQHKALVSALWRVTLIMMFKQRLTASCIVLILEICRILVFVFPFYCGET